MANIFQQYLQPVKSVMDYQADYDKADARKQDLAQNALTLAASRQKYDEGVQSSQRAAQLRAALSGLSAGATDDDRIGAMRGTGSPEGYAAADALDKSLIERRKGMAAANKDDAETAKANQARNIALHEFHAQKLAMVQTPQDALAWAQEGQQLGVFGQPGQYEQGVARIQQAAADPQEFAKWKQRAMQGGQSVTAQLTQQLEQLKQAEQTRQFGVTDQRIQSEGDKDRALSRQRNLLKAEENGIARDGVVGKRIQDVELKLQDDYRNESKGWSETSTSMKKILGAIETSDKNPGSALAAGTAFMKILDPNSVVRESELGMALNASGWFDRATNIASTFQSGRVMTAAQKTNLKAAAGNLFEEAKAAQREVDAAYRKRAVDYGADPARVIVDRGQNNPQRAAAQSASDIRAKADAILQGK